MSVGKQLIWVDLEVGMHTYCGVAFACGASSAGSDHWAVVILFFLCLFLALRIRG